MNEKRFAKILSSVREGGAILRGERTASRMFEFPDPQTPDAAALREHLKLTQPRFAKLLGVSLATLRNWEQKRRHPEGPARVLLRIAAYDPEVLLRASIPDSRAQQAFTSKRRQTTSKATRTSGAAGSAPPRASTARAASSGR